MKPRTRLYENIQNRWLDLSTLNQALDEFTADAEVNMPRTGQRVRPLVESDDAHYGFNYDD